ncbi:hypothetical protein DFQ26_004517 [Actinomortierella ambigua]|nr:hypothetical protein DFQ26_004517 [Actinomortierella ambigua]
MTTSPETQISPQTPKQDGVEVKKSSLTNPERLGGAIPSAPQTLPATPMSNREEDDDDDDDNDNDNDDNDDTASSASTESISSEDLDTKHKAESQSQVQDQDDQDQAETPDPTTCQNSEESLVGEEDKKPSLSNSKVVTEQGPEDSPSTASLPGKSNSNDVAVADQVKDDDGSLVQDGQKATREHGQKKSDTAVNEGEVGNTTLNDPTTACRTQPTEPIKKDNIADVNAEDEKDEDEKDKDEKDKDEKDKEGETGKEEKVKEAEKRDKQDEDNGGTDKKDSKEKKEVKVDMDAKHKTDKINMAEKVEKVVARREEEEETIYCNVIGWTTGRPCFQRIDALTIETIRDGSCSTATRLVEQPGVLAGFQRISALTIKDVRRTIMPSYD